jgi:hypothetical protein
MNRAHRVIAIIIASSLPTASYGFLGAQNCITLREHLSVLVTDGYGPGPIDHLLLFTTLRP